ncbi:hypothetical protein H5U35_03635 [Candidatus Aerophobetes bacterium]|nr:hypothetical protein [Candidatus Aerophobetes bacterium]
MEKLLRKLLIMGMGAAVLTREKMESFLEEINKASEKIEEEEFFSRMIRKGEEAREEFKKKMAEELRSLIEKANLATREDILRIEEKIERLEEIIKKQNKS